MLSCPNKNSPEWIALEAAVGPFEAMRDYMEYNGEIRSPELVFEKIQLDIKHGPGWTDEKIQADLKREDPDRALPKPVKEKPVSDKAQFKKLIGLTSNQVSFNRRAAINSRVKMANGKLGTSFYVKYKQVGQADLYTWEILDYATLRKSDEGAQTTMFFRDKPTGSLVELATNELEEYPLDEATNNKTRAIEIATEMTRALSNQLGIDYQFVNDQEALDITADAKNPWNGEPSFFIGGRVYFNADALRPDIVLHEFAHPLIRSIAVDNPALFDNLYEKLVKTPEGQAIIKEVNELYPEFNPHEVEIERVLFQEEALVRSLVLAAKLDKQNVKEPTGFAKFLKDILAAFRQMLRKVFGQKVDVAKLSASTTLEEIADMLMKGKNFKINTDKVTDHETAAYIREQREYIDDIMQISKPELMALTTRMYDIATKHIEVVQNNKNYEDMVNILADEYNRGDLQEIRKNLSKYTNKLTSRLKEVKDEIEFNRNHATAAVNTLFRLEGMIKKIHAHMEDLATDTDNVNNLHKAFYYDYLLKYWGSFIVEAKEALDEQKIPSDSPISQLVNNIDRTLEKSKKISQGMQAEGIKDVLFDELMPIAKTVDDRYKTIISDLRKRNASQAIIDKWAKEYYGLTEAENQRLEQLEIANNEGRLTSDLKKEYESLKLQSFNGAKLTPEKLDKALKGELGDANAFNSFFEGYMYNTDPVVGGLALYVKNQMTEVLAGAQAKFNSFATDMAPLLEAAGYNPANVSQLASKITHVQEVGTKDKDGNLISRKVLTFLSPHQDYRLVIDQHRHAIEVTERAYSLTGSDEDRNKMIDAISKLKELQRNYFHQEYVREYYDLEAILERDEIGKKAAYLRDNIFERMRNLTQPLETQMDEMEAGTKIDELWSEYRQLNSRFDLNGRLKTGEDLAIADRLKEYREASREFHEFKELKGVFQNALKSYEQELVDRGFGKDSDTFRVMRSEWIHRNTRTVVKPSFYERRKLILDRIAEIMSRVPDATRKNIDIGPLLKNILDISYTFRDEDGQPNGQNMSPDSIAEVKELEEQIIKLRENFAGLNGLTPSESQELNGYFETIKEERKLDPDSQTRMEMLLNKKQINGLSGLNKKELFKLFEELSLIQRKEATDYYVDIVNNWLSKLDTTKFRDINKTGIINKATADVFLTDGVINDLKDQSQEFADWFDANHIRKSKWNMETHQKDYYWERIYVWNVVRPSNPSDFESTEIKDAEGNVIETIEGVPTNKYFARRVKNEYRTKKIVGDTVDNKGQWLPRLDVENSPYINKAYNELKVSDPKMFAVLQKMTEHHIKNQEGLGYKSRLYLDVPRFRKTALEIVQTQQLQRTIKGAVEGRLPLLTILVKRLKLFWQRGKDAQEQGLNPKNDFMLVRADMFDNEVSNVPIAGLYDLDIDDVSTDLTHSMMRYMLSAERQKKLIEINPIARALQNVVNDDKNQVKRLDAVNRFNFINRGVVTYLNKKGFNTRRSAVNNFIEREFEGQTNTGMLTDVPWLNNTASLIFKRASFGFFAFNIPSALKNTIGAKFQGMIEAAAGKYMDMKSFTKGETWAFNTMGQISFEIYKKSPKSLNIQLVEAFDAIQGRLEEKFGESMSRTFASDTANLSWFYNFRKWTENQATLQTFAGMMYHQKVKMGDKEIPYIDAWQVKDGKVQLKDGVDHEWGITYDQDGNMKVGSQFKMIKNRMHQVINNLNGAYASFDQPEAQRYLAFRFVSFLRRYFTTMLTNRWGFAGGFGNARGRMNPGLGDVSEGYYVTVLKTLNRMVSTDAKYLGFMTKDEKRAWLKVTAELFSLMAISMLAVPLLGWDEDDKEKYEKLRDRSGAMPFLGLVPEDPSHPFQGYGFLENHLLNLAMQVRSENEQFIPWPNFGLDDYTSMLDLKSLATGPTLKAYKQMFTVGLDEITGDPSAYYKRAIGPYEWQQEGGSKFFNYMFKAIGLTGSTLDPVTAIKNAQGIIVRGK